MPLKQVPWSRARTFDELESYCMENWTSALGIISGSKLFDFQVVTFRIVKDDSKTSMFVLVVLFTGRLLDHRNNIVWVHSTSHHVHCKVHKLSGS